MTSCCLDKDLVPIQPGLRAQNRYIERIITWNPYSKKNLALCYQFHTGRTPASVRLIPDACVQFLFRCDKNKPAAAVCGIQSIPKETPLAPDTVYFGFKPYSLKGIRPLSAGWRELADTQAALPDILPDAGPIAEAIAARDCFDTRIALALEFALRRLADPAYSPDFVEYAEIELCRSKGNLRIGAVSDYTGYTGRYCRVKFKEDHGICLKSYASIMRFQNAVRMLGRADAGKDALAEVVYGNGYFDQSHLIREFRRLSGETPLRYRKTALP